MALIEDTSPWILAGLIGATIGVAAVLHTVIYAILAFAARHSQEMLESKLVKQSRWPMLFTFIFVGLLWVLPLLQQIEQELLERLRLTVGVLLTFTIGWLLVRLLTVAEYQLKKFYRFDMVDNLHARKTSTQIMVFKRLLSGMIVLLTMAVAIMSFEKARQIGQAMLVGAGIIGVIFGLSCSPVIENAIASLQLALTQPIRIDDVVIVDGEWGRIEEITSTYVVVLLWDQRRLIAPLTRFTKQSFQNWTRISSEILGTAFIYVDHKAPVQRIREELVAIVKESKHWDGRLCLLSVTDCKEHTMELRCLVSAKDASNCFDLRCLIREKLMLFIHSELHCLPKLRTDSKITKKKHGKHQKGTEPFNISVV